MSVLALAARVEIADLNARFAWALDLGHLEELRAVLAHDVHYMSIGREFHDVEQVIASFRARSGTRTTRHGLGNLLLEEGPDDTVLGRGSWHTFASNEDPPVGVALYMVADFHDVYRHEPDDGWRIAERIIRPVFRAPSLAPGEVPDPTPNPT